jgi:putative nucleotidyltransferase with HDIG domain
LVSYTRTVDLTALGIIVPLLVISYLTFKTSIGRVEDANRHVAEIKTLHLSTIETLATAIDAKDQVTHGHIRRVQQHTLGLARALGIKDDIQLKAIEAAALLHDMGKLVVPEHILNKPGKLTEGEFEKMKLHASVGADILSSIHFPYPVVPIVRHHHEHWDGRGYPDGLRGTNIPMGARILAVVDCYDALTSDRPYRLRLSDEAAVSILLERRGTMYDPLVVDAFIAVRLELAEASARLESSSEHRLPTSAFSKPEVPEVGPSQEWAASPELAHALDTVLRSIEAELKSAICLVYLKDAKRDDVVVTGVQGPTASRLIGVRVALGAKVSGWVAANGRPIVNADSRLELSSEFIEGGQCIAVPIHSRGAIVGVLSVFSRPSEPFSESAFSFIEHVAKSFDQAPLSGILGKEISVRRDSVSTQRQVIH